MISELRCGIWQFNWHYLILQSRIYTGPVSIIFLEKMNFSCVYKKKKKKTVGWEEKEVGNMFQKTMFAFIQLGMIMSGLHEMFLTKIYFLVIMIIRLITF